MAPGVVGLVLSSIHILSLLLFKFTARYILISNLMLSSSMIHQIVFSFYSGGFENNLVIWFALLPIFAGLTCGKKSALVWGGISLFVSLSLMIINYFLENIPNYLEPRGLLLSKISTHVGFILICTFIIYNYLKIQKLAESLLFDQKKKVEGLFKVLFHDLANPLSRLGIGISLLKREEVHPKLEKGFKIIQDANKSMLEITQNVKKMYAVSKGKVDLDLSPTSLNECVEFLNRNFFNELEEKKLQIKYDFKTHEQLKIIVEPVSFKHQVLGNILTNAIKFSNYGSSIHIEVRRIEAGLFSIDIRDEGVGIPQSLIPQLFKDDAQTYRPGTMGEKGAGFGLIIMKTFMEIYGGAINIRSRSETESQNHGTTFSLILPGIIQ